MSSENRRQVLQMLAEGKINADEAERLLSAVERNAAATNGAAVAVADRTVPAPNRAKYLRVVVDTNEGHEGRTKVNIRVPMSLLRAGVRLGALLPPDAREHVNEAMRDQGLGYDLSQLRPENLEELIEHLSELTVDVDQGDATKVRVFAE